MNKKRRKSADDAGLSLISLLCEQAIAYITLRNPDGGETVLGRGGYINLRDDRVLISCDNAIVLDAPLTELKVSELLSGNGAVFAHTSNDGARAVYVAYYVNYRI